jgi:hypothetical protein
MISNAELEAWLKERRRVKAFLQSCPLLVKKVWDEDGVAVAADWALERGWEAAEHWVHYRSPGFTRRAVAAGVDVPNFEGAPQWKTVWTTDEWRLRVDWTGVYPAELEIAEEGEPTAGGDAEEPVFNQDDNRWHLRDSAGNMTMRSWTDVNEAEDHIGFRLRDIDTNYLIYTVQLEQQKLVDGFLVPISWTPEWAGSLSSREEWFIDKLPDIVRSAGTPGGVEKLIELLCSDDPRALASAYLDIVGYYGPHEFDSYPIRLTEDEFNERWER